MNWLVAGDAGHASGEETAAAAVRAAGAGTAGDGPSPQPVRQDGQHCRYTSNRVIPAA